MTTYAQMGTSWPFRARVSCPFVHEHLADDVRRNDNAVGNQVALVRRILLAFFMARHLTLSPASGLPSNARGP